MAKVTVCVPDGEFCGDCRFLMKGTKICTLFDNLCEEDYPQMRKCKQCPRGVKGMELRPEVRMFAEEMEEQLRANEYKGGWKNCEIGFLIGELWKNYDKLYGALKENNKEEFLRRCANISNFAMMIADIKKGEE